MQVIITVAPPGQPAQPMQQQVQKLASRLEADAEVLAVFPNGGLQKIALTVKKFTGAADAAAEKDVLPAGAKVTGEKNGKDSVFTVDGKPAADDVAKFLKLAVEFDDPKHTDQDVFGSKAPVPVGGVWPVDGSLYAQEMKSDLGETLTAKGSMKLDAIKGEGDAQVATISGTVTFENIQAPFPPPFAVKSAEAKAELAGTQPATHRGSRIQSMNMTMKLVAEGTDAGALLKATMEMSAQTKMEVTYR